MKKSLLFCTKVLTAFIAVTALTATAAPPEKVTNCGPQSANLPNQIQNAVSSYLKDAKQICAWLKSLQELRNKPKVGIDILNYAGGFRISGKRHGTSEFSTMDFSYGVFTYDPSRNSIYVIGNPRDSAIAEFPVPELTKSIDISEFKVSNKPIQPFVKFYDTPKVDTGIKHYFRVTGLAKVDNALIVNYINWYDATGKEKDTSIMIWDSLNLANSQMYGPYQLDGSANAAGWISEVPEAMQRIVGGTHITGSQAFASINSRLSVGPSAFAFDARRGLVYAPSGPVPTIRMLDFPLKNFLHDKEKYAHIADRDAVLYNEDGNNDLWTILSGASFGFVVPGTRTYLTIGFSGGHHSGAGYKIKQDNGRECGGPCARSASDMYPFYWAWDVMDLIRARLGLIKPFDIRPYAYGPLSLPEGIEGVHISGGSYDGKNNRLFIAVKGGDKLDKYLRPPIFLVYDIKINE